MDQLDSTETETNGRTLSADLTAAIDPDRKLDDTRTEQGSVDKDKKSSQAEIDENGKAVLECPICLQTCQLPVQLPCSHIFCFLCVKGVVSRSRGCALCRQTIPSDYFYKPNLLNLEELDRPTMFDDGYNWFYEGTDGWWQYDDRTSKELETHHKAGRSSCELLIAGFVYIIDLNNMVQHRRNDRTKKRRVKRDLINFKGSKGIAGLKFMSENTAQATNDRPGADGHEMNVSSAASGQQSIPIRHLNRSSRDHHSCLPPTPHNTPQTPMTPSESPPSSGPAECDLSGPLRRLRLSDNALSSLGPQDGSVGSIGSSHDFDSPDSAANAENLRASLQQLQSEENDQDSSDALDDNDNPAAAAANGGDQ